jgi:hypothetical protein
MATMNEMFPARFLKAEEDIGEGIDELIITNLESQEMQTKNGKADKWVLFFDKLEKGLVLNKTNAMTLAKAFGPDSDLWTGRTVSLVVRDVQFGTDIVPAIRIVIPNAPVRLRTASGEGK